MLERRPLSSGEQKNFTFFQPKLLNHTFSSSLFLNFFKVLSFLTFVDLAFANGPSNPFAFLQANCSYSLTTMPLIDSEGRYRTWPAFESIVNHLINGTAGAITQVNKSNPAPNVWTDKICYVDFLLRSNCSKAIVAPFLNAFNAMLNNDTAVDDARKCLESELLVKVCLGVVAAIVLLACLTGIVVCIRSAIQSCNNRTDYDEIEDGQRLETVQPSSNSNS
jgi:hypothetical protein